MEQKILKKKLLFLKKSALGEKNQFHPIEVIKDTDILSRINLILALSILKLMFHSL